MHGGGSSLKVALAVVALLVLFGLASSQSVRGKNSNGAGGGNGGLLSPSARIQCECKDIDGDSLVLNCTLLPGGASLAPGVDTGVSVITGIDPASPLSSGNAVSTGAGNVRVGLDKAWRTPWESLSINHNVIRTLIWRHSRLRELGEHAFKDLNFLERLDLSHNKLAQLNAFSFANFELDLVELDLSHNQFEQVPVNVFMKKRLQRLQALRMNDNPITHVSRQPLEFVKSSLKTLELNNCQVRSIDAQAFEGMDHLESVSLVGNHIRTLNELTFKDLSLRAFYVHDNPLTCDCHMRWLINYLRNVDYQQQISSDSSSSVVVAASGKNQAASNDRSYLITSPGVSAPPLSVSAAAQQLLRCDSPNSLKSRPNFLEINPDSFMCDVQIALRDQVMDSATPESGAVYDAGDDAILVCDVYGDPEPNVYWSFGQKPIEKALNEVDKYYIHETRSPPVFKSQVSGQVLGQAPSTNKTSELRVKNLQASDVGVYTCTVEISGSNNRKQMSYTIRQVRGSGLAGLAGAGGLVVGGVGALAAATSSLFNRPLSNWTLLLLLAIVVSLLVFVLLLVSFICWKCRRRQRQEKRLMKEEQKFAKKEHEKLLMNGGNGTLGSTSGGGKGGHEEALTFARYGDQLDHHHLANGGYHQHSHLPIESSATLASNKMTNSIRMAYPNANTLNSNTAAKVYGGHQAPPPPHFPLNDIYTNHSLLTTTSTTTGSYLAAQNPGAIAIDASNQTPRYHMLPQQQQQGDSYYDDLRYNSNAAAGNQYEEGAIITQNGGAIYSSPYKQQQGGQSYSPLIRRDDPTVPLYATLKPKLMMQQQQQQMQRQYSNGGYGGPYSTMHRSAGSSTTNSNTPPLPLPRRVPNSNYQQIQLQLPPPPPPPPPVKPKRTFEYGVTANRAGDLHSESGAYLLAGDSTPVDYEQNELDAYLHLQGKGRSKPKTGGGGGSTTSLDEDLDLNDLKDFEDVTFDNLRKPGESRQQQQQQQAPSNKPKHHLAPSGQPKSHLHHHHHHHHLLQPQQQQQQQQQQRMPSDEQINTNSEQSLLLKSSSDKSTSSASSTTSSSASTVSTTENHNTAMLPQINTNYEGSQSTDLNAAGTYEETEI